MTIFDDISCASLPESALPRLAALRCEPGVQAARAAGRLWLRFEPGNERVLRGVFSVAGVELFACHDGVWRRFGQSLPAFDFPAPLDFEPLYQRLFPSPVLPIPAGDALMTPMRLSLKPDDRPRPTTAMICPLAALQAWADTVPVVQLERLHGVLRGAQMLVLGRGVPVLEGSERFWGMLMLAPLGCRPDPELPEAALREAAGIGAEELLVLRHEHLEALPRAALVRLSRAALRLAVEATP